jgi:hypothetical protein
VVRHRRRLLDRRSPSGPPPAVVALFVIELIVVVVLLTAGVAAGDLLKSAGPAIALMLAFLNPTVQELGRRKPKLTVQASEADRRGVVAAPALRPWPIDAERIVKNELAEARQTVDVGHTVLDTFTALADPFAVRPSAADHEPAKKAFDEQWPTTRPTCARGWSTTRRHASRARRLRPRSARVSTGSARCGTAPGGREGVAHEQPARARLNGDIDPLIGNASGPTRHGGRRRLDPAPHHLARLDVQRWLLRPTLTFTRLRDSVVPLVCRR